MIDLVTKRPARALAILLFLGTSSAASAKVLLEGSAPKVMASLSGRWVRKFNAAHAGSTISVPPPYGPPQGTLSPRLAAFLEGNLDFAFLSRKLADADVATFRKGHGFDPLVIPVALGSWKSFGLVDPVVVIVNASNPVSGLSFSELDAIFSKARLRRHLPIRTWREVEKALPDRPIHVVGGAFWAKSDDSARAGVFRERVLLGGDWRDGPDIADGGGEADVSTRVASDPAAIGFTGLGHLLSGTRAVPIADDDHGPYVAPTFAAVASARYPLTRTLDILVARRPGACLSPKILSFVRYVLGQGGQREIRREGHFLELTPAQVRSSWLRASSCR